MFPTEEYHRELEKFIAQSGVDVDDESKFDELLSQFTAQYNEKIKDMAPLTENTAKDAYDYVSLAEDADTVQEAYRLARKALKIDPDNIDAMHLTSVYGAKDFEDGLKHLGTAVEKAKKIMKKQGYFDEANIGEFWAIWQTRPFIRLMREYFSRLVDSGRMRMAAEVGEEIIRLNNGDNTGVRSVLMHVYAYLIDEKSALGVLERFSEHDESNCMLPMSILCYRMGDSDTALKYLKRAIKVNNDLKKYIRGDFTERKLKEAYEKTQQIGGYEPFSIQELIVTMDECYFLYGDTLEWYWKWADSAI